MRTYVQDQWIRHWFMGGADCVDYSVIGQLNHLSPERFAAQLKQVWNNAATASRPNARLIVRFGGIRDRNVEPLDIIKESFRESAWRLQHAHEAGNAASGKRQADVFLKARTHPMMEYDCWARLD